MHVIVYIFADDSKIVVDYYSKVERHLEDFLRSVSTYVIDMYHTVQYLTVPPKNSLCTVSLLVNGVYNLESFAKYL